MKKKIKMIGFDCDGTLLNDRKELTEFTKDVLRKAIERGIIVLAATGRPLTGVPKEVLAIPGVRYALTSNGARIVDVKEKRVLYEKTMSLTLAHQVLSVFEKYDTYKEVFINGTGYADAAELSRADEYVHICSMAKYLRECRVPVEDVRRKMRDANSPVDKVHALFRDRAEKEAAFEEILNIEGVVPTGAMENNVEVNAKGVNKGVGLLKLGEMLGIQRDEIMAFGDGMNDLEMLRAVGFGVAVANAVQPVKDAADYITESNENDGVAKAIIKFALE